MAPSSTMLESAAYARLRAENAAEFVPRSVFFAHEKGSEMDRRNSLWVKAALVYESITGRHVNDKAKPVATHLLLTLADTCCSRIHHRDPPQTTAKSAVSDAKILGVSTPKVTGEAVVSHGAVVYDAGEQNRQDQSIISQAREKQAAELHDEGSDDNKRVIDGIFLVVGFLPRLLTTKGGARKQGAVSRDAVDEGFKSTHMQDIVTDVIKLENQLPLKHLLDVVDHVEAAIRDAGNAGGFDGLEDSLRTYKLGFNRRTFGDVVRSFCWYYSPFFSKQPTAVAAPAPATPGDDAEMGARTLLDCLHASLVPRAAEREGAGSEGGGKTSRMPTARDLSRSGVRLVPGEDGRAAVEFDEPSSRLRLPALVYDFKLATVARNLLAREYEEQSKPVTRYFQMMNELVEEAADVRILRRAGVVRGGSSGAHEVHELIKKIEGYATYPSVFMAMDVQIEKVKRFHDKRMQNFFVRYRPGVIWASSVAAVSVVAIVAARRNRA